MSYFERLRESKDRLVQELVRRGIHERYLGFGGPGEVVKVTVPTDARSEFLANRAMGDWAEDLLASAISATFPSFRFVHYGDSDRMAAGEHGFKEFYVGRIEDVRIHGKRPDLLILPREVEVASDVSGTPTGALADVVRAAIGSVEVRSSKFEALTYMRVRHEERQGGEASGRGAPSFTVKVEDLKIVYRWVESFRVPQMYCQVFFDSIFAMNLGRIFEIIASGLGFTIEQHAKSQDKSTIMIPITAGEQVGTFTGPPHFEARERVTRLGRHDAYVSPAGGKVTLDGDRFLKALSD